MRCVEPGATTPEDLIAYASGEASPEVRAHLRRCPHCAARAGEYARAERGLRRALHRFDCPPSQTLGEYELGLLPPQERAAIAAHAVACPRCADELRQLRTFLATEPALPRAGPLERARRIVATLVGPAPAPAAAYAGVRGAGDEAPRLFRAADITVTISASGGNLVGTIARDGAVPELPAGTMATLSPHDAGGQGTVAEVDELGGFGFAAIAPGHYRLEIDLGDRLVTIEGFRVGD